MYLMPSPVAVPSPHSNLSFSIALIKSHCVVYWSSWIALFSYTPFPNRIKETRVFSGPMSKVLVSFLMNCLSFLLPPFKITDAELSTTKAISVGFVLKFKASMD